MASRVITPTVESVRVVCARARQFIESHHLCLEATIEDYPATTSQWSSLDSNASEGPAD
jgi:hypothetical protein